MTQELYPGNFKPTPTHHFMRLLHDKGLLTRVYTQNIDSLEALAGIPADKVIAAHGNFDSARCISCKSEAHLHAVKASVMDGKVCLHLHPMQYSCVLLCTASHSLASLICFRIWMYKPDVVAQLVGAWPLP